MEAEGGSGGTIGQLDVIAKTGRMRGVMERKAV